MSLSSIKISGLRGVAETQEVRFAQPSGEAGSGLTILVGANNSGKSTLIEAIDFLRERKAAPTFGEGRRNAIVRGRIQIEYIVSAGGTAVLGTNPLGGGNPRWSEVDFSLSGGEIFVVSSRRGYIDSGFQNTEAERHNYQSSAIPGDVRGQNRQMFGWRLVRMHNNRSEIDAILGRILGEVPEWTVEPTSGSGQQYQLRFYTGYGSHPAEGVGEGLVSLLFLADALYDSRPGDIIVIDEPELSLHPEPQRRLAEILAEYAADRQIVYATHSPYFADWQYVFGGAQVVRVYREEGRTRFANLRPETVQRLKSLLGNHANPHVLGIDAREVFFLNDPVLLVEGQEDVVGYQIIASSVSVQLAGRFYVWGVGGAGNMGRLGLVLRDLAFKRVAMLLDADQAHLADPLRKEFPEFSILVSPVDDVRTKRARPGTGPKQGFLDEHWSLPAEQREIALAFMKQVNASIQAGSS
ncbi:MAG TPA: AAA family ATPase [Longimicrobium sp.]|nr:AAA family ATPase [Longimicrobium sp.]